VDFNGIAAQSVRLTANSNWSNGTITKVGLSEVRFMYIPVLAREPYPEDKASDVSVESALIWRAGRGVDKHNLYIGTDVNAVTEGTASVIILDEAAYAPNLELGSTYYWRVDEVNEAEEHTIWIGPVWNFSTITDFVVENFEAGYDDSDANAVWATWIDGYGNESVNGGIIGYDFPGPYLSTTNHSGGHSVPLRYDNTTAGYSEATAQVVDLPIGTTDWRTGNPGVLVIWFYGDPANNAQNMYVKINNKKVVYGNSADLLKPLWIQWNIDLNTAGINLANVTSLTIGLEKIGGIGGRGTVLIDDMRLYREAPAVPSEMVWVEAETGTVTAPMMMYDDVTASGGRYVSTTDDTADEGTAPPYPNGTVTIPFTVEGGTYTVRFLIGFPGGDDSCWVRIPGAAIQSAVTPLTNGWMEFNDIPTGDYWHWSQSVKHEGGAEPPVEFTLSAGTHNIEISYRANALRFDVILFTKID
ncbi:MAG: hypothetical protein JW787_15605, partial [Sedimentisphaerales bacterium]|nr:hypothetical protein [Sedimentisphaerales bacterium]